MVKNKRLKYKIYGLQPENDHKVDLGVFVKKLGLIEKTLRKTDYCVNGHEGFDYLIQNLNSGSAEVVLEEIPKTPLIQPDNSPIEVFQNHVSNIGNGKGHTIEKSNKEVAELIKEICTGVKQSFSHAEFGIDGEESSTVLLDKSFQEKAKKTTDELRKTYPLFKGTVYESYDGYLKEVDLRNDIPKARLVLFVNKIDLKCNCKSIPITTLRNSLDKPVTVYAKAIYNGISRLPTLLDLTRIDILKQAKNLSDWQGKFELPYRDPNDIW